MTITLSELLGGLIGGGLFYGTVSFFSKRFGLATKGDIISLEKRITGVEERLNARITGVEERVHALDCDIREIKGQLAIIITLLEKRIV